MARDTIIKDGLIVDGDGAAPYHGDVAIRDGKIVGLGSVNDTAARVIDAGWLAVAPGFWDVHTHDDAQLLWDPLATSSSWHGVTTIVMGNCGFTLAPCRPDDQDWLVQTLARVEGMNADVLRRTLPWRWEDFRGYLDTLDQAQQQTPPGLLAEIERDVALAVVRSLEQRPGFIPVRVAEVDGREEAEAVWTPSRLDLDHVGAERGEVHRHVGPRPERPQIENAETAEGEVRVVPDLEPERRTFAVVPARRLSALGR